MKPATYQYLLKIDDRINQFAHDRPFLFFACAIVIMTVIVLGVKSLITQ